jgi:hypothetical protein
MQVRDDGSLILATHNRTYPMVAMSASCQKRTLVIRSKRQPYPSSASILLGRPMTRLRAIVRNRLPARCALSVVE